MKPNGRHFVLFGQTRIWFEVIRSSRRRTVSLCVDAEGGLIVRAPEGIPDIDLSAIVLSRGVWIVQHLRLADDAEKPIAREFVTGEGLLYLGRHYRLRVVPTRGTLSLEAALRGGWLDVAVDTVRSAAERAEDVGVKVKAWYVRRARARIPERVEQYSRILGLSCPPVSITDQGKRWGSCDSQGRLRINWRIIMAPMTLVDYVVAHELCHLRYPDHSARFWKELAVVMPDYRERRAALRRKGPAFAL